VKTLLVGALAASLLVAAVVAMFSATRTPTYEASAVLLVAQQEQNAGKIQPIPNYHPHRLGGRQALAQTMVIDIETRPVAKEAIRRLGLEVSPEELLDNLTVDVEQVGTAQSIQLSYTDTDPMRARLVVNAVGRVSSERISEADAISNNITANVWKKAEISVTPASPKPLRNGLIALVVALALSAALIGARRRVWLNEEREG
jgi:capsular polysaccharide biosynthesis protein